MSAFLGPLRKATHLSSDFFFFFFNVNTVLLWGHVPECR